VLSSFLSKPELFEDLTDMLTKFCVAITRNPNLPFSGDWVLTVCPKALPGNLLYRPDSIFIAALLFYEQLLF